MSRVKRK